ncbi:MAG: FemAB family PEP-CTERM system-associated protein [Planctomycetaceae bacterium]|nr:FemAB family PEP-CTERM system-associated protein [Planctomycetaceae bacterium]
MFTTIQTANATCVRCETSPPAGWNSYLQKWSYDGFHLRTEWADVFSLSLRHQPWYLWVEQDDRIVGVLPLMYIEGPVFGRFLASQPYLNTGGVLADTGDIERRLIDQAIILADKLDVRHLELRHERHVDHPALNGTSTEKVHMRLALPNTTDELWDGLKSKLRSQIRKPLNNPELRVGFGGHERLNEFYDIFCRNMRDLGTPPFSRQLFAQMLDKFGDNAEICTVTLNGNPVASGFLLHGPEVTLIPSASSLREYNQTSCNLLMYWHVLSRAVERGQKVFDFGRSSQNSGTYKFKQQWGSDEYPAIWQYYSRRGDAGDMRPGSGRFNRVIEIWKRLPVWFTRVIGPTIVRGIP